MRCLIAVAVEWLAGLRSHCLSELIEGRCDTELQWSIGGEFVVAAADVLNEGVPGDDSPGADVGFQAAHRSQPSFQLGVVGFDPVIGVPFDAMPSCGKNLFEDPR